MISSAYRTFILLGSFLLFGASLAHADEFMRPMRYEELGKSSDVYVERSIRVKGARVAWANYERIRHDFPAVAQLSDPQIDEWLVHNFAFIGSNQQKLNHIRNTEIPVDESEMKNAFRPPTWRRSAILEARAPGSNETIGMVDIKGFGHGSRSLEAVSAQISQYEQRHTNPFIVNGLRIKDHSDGLMSFGEAIAETTRQQAAQKLFELSPYPLETVDTYAILHMPFYILKKDGEKIPAASYLRQAHVGRTSNLGVPKNIYIDPHGSRQATDFGTAVDFGGVIIEDPRLAGNFSASGSNPQDSKPWAWGHDTAKAYERGDHEAIIRHRQEMLAGLSADLKSEEAKKLLEARRAFQQDMEKRTLALGKLSFKDRSAQVKKIQYGHPYFEKAWKNALQTAAAEEYVLDTLYRKDVTPKILIEALRKGTQAKYAFTAATVLRDHHDLDYLPVFEFGLNSEALHVRKLTASSLATWSTAPIEIAEKGLRDPEVMVRAQLAIFARREDLPLDLFEKLLTDENESLRMSASYMINIRKDIPLATIVRATQDSNAMVSGIAKRFLKTQREKLNLPCENVVQKIIP